ncbi:maltodextrin phosphorylase [Bacillus coahuilensis p1.1.43]|uniref:Alpha-1,4 glucan phosphorylase n=1 Tax=Bacillus coahuilensis p1.1.43 TaxID=1150625 RepID=A0A147K6E7_9BACI|nr:glycogen/starch/alpha-glucan phosphorylase [Bacillus coahuilensis]KUP05452.1 maltodextrin phosphorylase [Bacillus coahuilensis p1.1.43]
MFSDKNEFKESFLKRIEMSLGKAFPDSTKRDQFHILGNMIREHISTNWIQTNEHYRLNQKKQVYYLSIEFLLGRLLGQNLLNLGIYDIVQEGLHDLGISLHDLEEVESDAGLGNGGLGRLAACFMDSLASLDLPGHGYGIRYKHGLFEQRIVDGFQVELPEQWLRHGHVWEVRKPDLTVEVPFWGRVETIKGKDGKLIFEHRDAEYVSAVPYDLPVVGYQNTTVNTLRLWSAEPSRYQPNRDMMRYKRDTEAISEFLYPDDTHDEGKILRLKQQYFLVSASVKTILRQFSSRQSNIEDLPEHVAIHINDTHPVLAIPELMRILLDEYGLDWDKAWRVTTKTFCYTNHTTLSEALEKWSVRIFQPLLPRIYGIVHEINERYCQQLWEKYPGEWDRIKHMAIISYDEVKMAHLAIAGSYSVNGVAKLHTDILKTREMNMFYNFSPEKFNNKTNGITHRRWLLKSNPELTQLLVHTIGDSFIKDPEQLMELERYSNDSVLQEDMKKVKQIKKEQLAARILDQNGLSVDTESIFDVQVKRLHAYKRQLLNVLHIMYLYNRIKEDSSFTMHPQTFIFGAKASPGYYYAKKIIKLIHSVANKVNHDPKTKDLIKVVFLENYRVSLAEEIIPAANVSEQISTASKEASGTGNMKFMMNGALTIGTLDGANVEMAERVGQENMFIFGLRSEQVLDYYSYGGYVASEYYHHDERIRQVVNQLVNGFFSDNDEPFDLIYDSLLTENDYYFVLRDFSAYVDAHEKINATYKHPKEWLRKSILNIAHSGYFSSDRTIAEYAKDIWGIEQYSLIRK